MNFTGERFIPDAINNEELEIEHKQRYHSITDIIKDKVVVDIACGEGYGSSYLAGTAQKVYGIDIDQEVIDLATEKYKTNNLEFIKASVENIPLEDKSVDVITSFETIEHVSENIQHQFLKEIKRLLKEDGVLIISTPDKSEYSDLYNYKNEFHVKEFYKDEFHDFLSGYFKQVKFYFQRFEAVSIISEKNTKLLKSVENKRKVQSGKYIIALCSDLSESLNYNISSMLLSEENEYRKSVNRILELQEEVEKLAQWGKSQDEEIEKKNNIISSLQIQNNELNKIRQELKQEINRQYTELNEIQAQILEEMMLIKNNSTFKKIISFMAGCSSQDYDYTSKLQNLNFKQETNPLVSIIIPAKYQIRHTYRCLKALSENTDNIPFEVIFVNDGLKDLTKMLDKYVKNISFINNKKEYGYIKACNYAAKSAKGKYLVFLNNDTEVKKNWLKPIIDLFESDKSIGAVGSKLLFPDEHLEKAGGILWKDGAVCNYGRFDNPEKSEYNYVREIDYIPGACIAVNKSVFDEIKGFDENYDSASYENSDIALSIRHKGYKIIYQPLSLIINHNQASKQKSKQQTKNNKKIFMDKWAETLKENHFSDIKDLFLARDRSMNKKTIVFIDHYVPMIDQDAGSKSTFSYVKLFLKLGFNVKFMGDNFFKHEPYTTILQQMGVEVLYGTYYSENWREWFERNSASIDYVFCNRPHITKKYIDFIKEYTQAKILYYGHDLHFLRTLRQYEIEQDERLLKEAERWKKQELELIEKSDVAYYPSQAEIDLLRKEYNLSNVKAIPLYIFDKKTDDVIYNAKDRKDLLFVGGFSHTPNPDAVLWFVKKIFPKVLNVYPDIKFYVVGSNPPDKIKELAGENIIITGHISEEELNNYYKKIRLVTIPLRYGAGIKGKVLESIYNNLPVVTTSIGAEGINEAANIMFIADSEEDFAQKIIDNYNNYENLNAQIQKYSGYIEKNFSDKAAYKIIGNDIEILTLVDN